MKKLVPAIIASFILGFGVSKMMALSVENQDEEEVVQEISPELKGNAEALKEKIITRYITEKDPAKRLEISDEIMEKVILLFMANLGIKLTDSDKSLIEDPKPYEKYIKDVMTLCPALPKDTGPEVFLNDGSDEMRKKLERDLRTCKETYGGLNKKPKLKTDEQKRRFINFEDNIFKKFGRTPQQIFPFDIVSELWTEGAFEGGLQTMPERFLKEYVGESDGIYRTRSGEQGYIKVLLESEYKKEDKSLHLVFKMTTRLGVQLKETFQVGHPEGHSNTGAGPCRGLVLYNGKNRHAHLVKIPGREGFFGRFYSKERMVSSFFVMKDFSKKKLNPSKWGRDRGYW